MTIASRDSVQKSVVTCFAAGRIFFRTTGDRKIFSTKNDVMRASWRGENLGSSDFDAQNLKISISTASFWGMDLCNIYGLFGCSIKRQPPQKTHGQNFSYPVFGCGIWSMESWNSWKRIKAEIFGNKPLLRAVRFWTFMVVELPKESIPAPKCGKMVTKVAM